MLNEPCTQKCRYIAGVFNETEHWNLERLPEPHPDRVVSVYLFSPDIGEHLCEATKSTALHFVECRGEWDVETDDDEVLQARERVNDDIQYENGRTQQSVDYMHRSDVLRKFQGLQVFLDNTDDIEDEDGIETLLHSGPGWTFVGVLDPETPEEELLEYCQQNSVV